MKILPLHGSIMTTKVNADDPTDKISGATFGVYSDADGDGIFNAKTDKLVGTLQEATPAFIRWIPSLTENSSYTRTRLLRLRTGQHLLSV